MFLTATVTASNAGWQGPTETENGIWGSGVGQFGLENGDSGDIFPKLEAITSDDKIVISDIVNKKQLVFNIEGRFIKEVPWTIKAQGGDRTTYSISEYSFGYVLGYSSDGNIYASTGNNYYLKSSTGQVLKAFTTKPSELGVVSEKHLSYGQSKVTVTYPGKEWSIIGKGRVPKYTLDRNSNLYGSGDKQAIRYSACGKELARLTLSADNIQEESQGEQVEPDVTVLEGYGAPLIAPNGDVYTWKRTPDTYSILKWTWVDDPNVLTGPDAPTGLTIMPSTSGLYLTWTASPNDPGCVTGYEVARATTAGGVTTTVATVDKGVVKYNDTTAEAGTTYYYKVRAKAGSEYSPYTNEVSGKR
jgi:hypothetical protein